MMYIDLQEVVDHIKNKENNYNYELLQEKLFGGYFFWVKSIGASTYSRIFVLVEMLLRSMLQKLILKI